VVPGSLQELVEKETGKTLKQKLTTTQLKDKVKFTNARLRIENNEFEQLFIPCCRKIVNHIEELLQDPCVKGTDTILMVGGFSKYKILQKFVKINFSNMKIIIPPDAETAVLKGAVLFGHNPSVISSRIARYTYGVQMHVNFQEGFHKEDKRELVGNRWKCRDVFSKHIERGQSLVVGEAQVARRYLPVRDNQEYVDFNIYASSQTRFLYVTDNCCKKIGSISVGIPSASVDEERPVVVVTMIYGGTEISVQGRSEKNNTTVCAKIDFSG